MTAYLGGPTIGGFNIPPGLFFAGVTPAGTWVLDFWLIAGLLIRNGSHGRSAVCGSADPSSVQPNACVVPVMRVGVIL